MMKFSCFVFLCRICNDEDVRFLHFESCKMAVDRGASCRMRLFVVVVVVIFVAVLL